jgi:hypothetical protein
MMGKPTPRRNEATLDISQWLSICYTRDRYDLSLRGINSPTGRPYRAGQLENVFGYEYISWLNENKPLSKLRVSWRTPNVNNLRSQIVPVYKRLDSESYQLSWRYAIVSKRELAEQA